MMLVPRSPLNRELFTRHDGKDYCSTVGEGCGRHTRLSESMVAIVEKSLNVNIIIIRKICSYFE